MPTDVFLNFFVNKSLFAATKVDFYYFGHIFVLSSTRCKGLTTTINFIPDKLFHILTFKSNVRVLLFEQNVTQNIRPKNGT